MRLPLRWPRSLRARLLVGSVLWTLGLVVVAHMTAVYALHAWRGGVPFTIRYQTFIAIRLIMVSLAAVFMVGGFLLVRRGLSALEQLRARLGPVRTGLESRLEGRYPSEVQPLVDDLNLLLEHRERVVRRALAKAGDLAHGLKTPLTVLSQAADRAASDGDAELASLVADQVERMQRQVDYHLAHARAAAAGPATGARSEVATALDALRRTLLHLHAGRDLEIDVRVAPGSAVRVGREDLDEMLGNLLDNGCQWARRMVRVEASRREPAPAGSPAVVIVTIDDDGPGLAASLREKVLLRGVRADESAPGSGLGLAIVRDLAELYGGSIALAESPAGGLRAILILPAA